jgi:glucose uptake protein
VLMGIFYPLVTKAVTGEHFLGPYSVAFFFALGVVLCGIPVNYLFMKKPLTGTPPVDVSQYFQAKPAWHFWASWVDSSGVRERSLASLHRTHK